jgi:hypothetical protein
MLWSQEGHRPRLQLPSGCASNPLPGKAFGARPNAGSPRLRVGPNLFSSSDRFRYASENAGVGRATSTPKHCAKRAPHPRPLHLDVPTPNPEAPLILLIEETWKSGTINQEAQSHFYFLRNNDICSARRFPCLMEPSTRLEGS